MDEIIVVLFAAGVFYIAYAEALGEIPGLRFMSILASATTFLVSITAVIRNVAIFITIVSLAVVFGAAIKWAWLIWLAP